MREEKTRRARTDTLVNAMRKEGSMVFVGNVQRGKEEGQLLR